MSMLDIQSIRENTGRMLAFGNYKPGYQAILDFDYLCGKVEPSIVGIVTTAAKFQKYFWGEKEVLIPCFSSAEAAKRVLGSVDWMFNTNSARRALSSTHEFFEAFPQSRGGHIFAEDVPEKHALELRSQFPNKVIVGPAGVGLLVPSALKLGVIGGVDYRQLLANKLMYAGSVAVVSASGGMVNEIITMVATTGHGISFSVCVGGDRFPTLSPLEALLAAESDPATKHIVYYGELGGYDEYEIATMLKEKKITKPLTCYIAGVIDEGFDTPVQFGHAKALAGNKSETASAKRTELSDAGAIVANSMQEFLSYIQKIPEDEFPTDPSVIGARQATRFTSTISSEPVGGYAFAGTLLQDWAREGSIALQLTTALLGKRPKSPLTSDFLNTVFLLSVDHGPQVSGALNTIITARAGKGIVDSLAAGLLTVGPRFGGAVTDAARAWFEGVRSEKNPDEFVEDYASTKKLIGGIGHKKYRLGLSDPRVAILADFADKLPSHRHYDFARSVETVTTAKKGSLILNVDGTIAALMLDILEIEENYTVDDLRELIEIDFFNALFIIPRIVGFTAHYLDQKRLDEGLFRLPDEDVLLTDLNDFSV